MVAQPKKVKSKRSLWLLWFIPGGTMRSCLRNVRLPERLQSKLGEETTRGNRVNMRLCKAELKVNLEQSTLELEHKETVKEEHVESGENEQTHDTWPNKIFLITQPLRGKTLN